MTNRELSQVIRKDLKEHGITSKDVSVRVRDALYDTSVNIGTGLTIRFFRI